MTYPPFSVCFGCSVSISLSLSQVTYRLNISFLRFIHFYYYCCCLLSLFQKLDGTTTCDACRIVTLIQCILQLLEQIVFGFFVVVVIVVFFVCAVAAVAAQTFPLRFCDRVHENIEFMTQMCHFIENTIYRIRGASECAVFYFFDLFFRPNINEIPTHYFLASVWPTRE